MPETSACEARVALRRIALVDGKFEAFATPEQLKEGGFDLVVAGTKEGIMMVEAGADEVPEEQVIEALAWAQEAIQPAVELQLQLCEKVGIISQEYELTLPDEAIQ